MRHLDSQWRLSIGWCLFAFILVSFRGSLGLFILREILLSFW